MSKRKVNERSIEQLRFEMDQLKKEKSKYWHENESLKNRINIYHEIVITLINDPSFWSEKALKTNMIERLKNLLK